MIDDTLLKSQFLGRDQFTWWIGQVAHPKYWRDDKTEIVQSQNEKELGMSWAYRLSLIHI